MKTRVVVRFRPDNSRETVLDSRREGDELEKGFIQDGNDVTAFYDLDRQYFTFDTCLPQDTSQEEVCELVVRPSVDDVFDGINATVMAYGQTGAGKSYTMMGPAVKGETSSRGAIPRVCSHIFDEVKKRKEAGIDVRVVCSCLQIYQEIVYDMLDPSQTLRVRETPDRGVWVDNLTEHDAGSVKELLAHVRSTEKTRRIGCTDMSEHSSRSHSVYIFRVTQVEHDGSQLTGKLCLVDLAGSEKVAKSGVRCQMLSETNAINKSLSALGNCIQALVKKKTSTSSRNIHIPYRDSKLTHILQDSLGGNARQTLIVACSAHWSSYDETISSLRFATRAKQLRCVATSNQTDAQSRTQQELTAVLKLAAKLEDHMQNEHVKDVDAAALVGSIKKRTMALCKLDKALAGKRGSAKDAELSVSPTALAESEGQRVQLLERIEELEEEMQRSESLAEESEQAANEMRDELERLQEEFEDVEQQVINRDRIIEALRDELQQLKTQREAALESIQQKKAFKVSPDKQAKGSPDKSAKLQVEVMRLRAKCESLQNRLVSSTSAPETDKENVVRPSNAVWGASQDLSNHDSCNPEEQLQFENVELRLKYEENSANMKSMERANKMLQLQINTLRKHLPDLQRVSCTNT